MENNIFICYPSPNENKSVRFGCSLSLLYSVSIAKNAKFNVVFRDYSIQSFDECEFCSICKDSSILIVEFDAYPLKRSENGIAAQRLLDKAKSTNPHIFTIACGKLLSISKQFSVVADVVLTSPIERVLQKLLDDYKKNDLKSSYVEEANYLPPYPAREYLDEIVKNNVEYNRLAKSTIMRTSYGCRGACSFCQRMGWNSDLYLYPDDYVVKEFNIVRENDYINIWIEDDNFSADTNRAKRILRSIARSHPKWKISLSSWVKIDFELLDLMKNAGVSVVSFGIETLDGDSQRYYNKVNSPERIEKIISYADSIGLYTVGNFIIGSPYETAETVKRNMDFACAVPFDQVNVKTLDYMKGAPLFELLPDSYKEREHVFASRENNLCPLSSDDIKNLKADFYFKFKKNVSNRLKNKIIKFGLPYIYR